MCAALAIVGTGPTGIYTFKELIEASTPQHIWLFEKGEKAGVGMPYSPHVTTKHMLANIASIEIPPVISPYLDWLLAQPDSKLATYGLTRAKLHERSFTPRLLLGEYYRDQFLALVRKAQAKGHTVKVVENNEVIDVISHDPGLRLTLLHPLDALPQFRHVFLVTGHDFRGHASKYSHYYPSPWSGLIDEEVPLGHVGIMGTSLSSLDAAMAVAYQHGHFKHENSEHPRYIPDKPGLSITMMSRSGILPEADFYCPIPYQPLSVMTDEALQQVITTPSPLEGFFALFCQELQLADPEYAHRIRLSECNLEQFSKAYFAERAHTNPFTWAEANLAEVEAHKRMRYTVPWRYAILRMHEKIHTLFHAFSPQERKRFHETLKKVFVDNYGAVPSESIRRLLALYRAGILNVVALGDAYKLKREHGKTIIEHTSTTYTFDAFIDARGQKPFETIHLPFPSLREALLSAHQDIPHIDEHYSLIDCLEYTGKVSLGSLPYLMHDRPFIQGITAAAEVGKAMAQRVNRSLGQPRRRYSTWSFQAISEGS